MIKLAIILDDPGHGGAYNVAKDVGKGLDSSAFEVRYYFLCAQPDNPQEGIFLGEPNITIDYSLKSYLRLAYSPKPHEKNFLFLNEALGEFQPNIVHFHTHATLLPLLHGIRTHHPKARLMYTDHSQRIRPGELSSIKQYLMSGVYRRLFRSAHVAYVSRYAYQTALQLGYGSQDKDWLISNTIDISKFRPAKTSPSDSIKVVYLSRIHHAKGHQGLLDAWHLLPQNNNVSLYLYGSEADGGSVRKRIQQENFPNPVYCEGGTASPEVVLQNAHIGVFPSFREGLPLAMLEMMASGLPVVASDIPEIKSVITDDQDGLLYSLGNAAELANKLLRLISDESLRIRLGQQARRTVKNEYGEPIAIKYHQLYTKYIRIETPVNDLKG